MRNFYPAKILLFGEHRVLRGARALAVPFDRLGAQWTPKGGRPDQRLLAFARYLGTHFSTSLLQHHILLKDLQNGRQLLSNVPTGYGLGSSGTVCAAIWDRYATPTSKGLGGKALQQVLAKMEAFFHGQSSGTDPLISYYQKTAKIGPNGLEWCTLPANWAAPFFLLDSRLPRQSAPLIAGFLHRYDTDAAWREAVNSRWGAADDECINALFANESTQLREAFFALSMYQGALARDLIPASLRPIWRGESYRLKICGAGGGGYLLGYTTNWQQTKEELANWSLLKI